MSLTMIALVYALAGCSLGWGVLLVAGRNILPEGQFRQMLVAWFGLTFTVFLMPTGAAFLLVATLLLLLLRAAGGDPIVLWLFLLGAVPTGGLALQGLPFGINYLFDFTFAILLSLIIAIPLLFAGERRTVGHGAAGVDALFVFAMIFMIFLSLRGTESFTSWLREAFVLTVSMVVPYFAISRRMGTIEGVDRAMRALLCSFVVMAAVGFLGAVVGWMFYDLPDARLFQSIGEGYLRRAGLLRSGSTLGGAPIVFGLLMAIGAVFALGVRDRFAATWQFAAVFGLCCLGLIASVSRGPMIGLAIALIAYQFTQPGAVRNLARLAVVAPIILVPLVLFTTTGRELLNMLPFIGTGDEGSVSYRSDLLAAGFKVFLRSPLFGAADYLEAPEMQAMIQGQGIIDMVNTYLWMTLLFGLVTSVPFTAALLVATVKTFRLARALPMEDETARRWRRVGGALFAAQVGFLFVIGTMSFISLVPVLTCLLLGLNVSYIRTVTAWSAERAAPVARPARTEPERMSEGTPEPEAPLPMPPSTPRPAASFGPQTSLEELGLEGFRPIGSST